VKAQDRLCIGQHEVALLCEKLAAAHITEQRLRELFQPLQLQRDRGLRPAKLSSCNRNAAGWDHRHKINGVSKSPPMQKARHLFCHWKGLSELLSRRIRPSKGRAAIGGPDQQRKAPESAAELVRREGDLRRECIARRPELTTKRVARPRNVYTSQRRRISLDAVAQALTKRTYAKTPTQPT
jgi:hypothetical protein